MMKSTFAAHSTLQGAIGEVSKAAQSTRTSSIAGLSTSGPAPRDVRAVSGKIAPRSGFGALRNSSSYFAEKTASGTADVGAAQADVISGGAAQNTSAEPIQGAGIDWVSASAALSDSYASGYGAETVRDLFLAPELGEEQIRKLTRRMTLADYVAQIWS